MNKLKFEINRVAETLIEQCEFFNCSLDMGWKSYMHPIITEQFSLQEVKEYINKCAK